MIYVDYMLGILRLHMYVYSFVQERYHNMKYIYRNSPYYKWALTWDTLPNENKRCNTLLEFKNKFE